MIALVAHRDRGWPIQVREPGHPLAAKDRVDRRAGMSKLRPEAVRLELPPATRPHDPPDLAAREGVRAPVRRRGSILEASRPFLAEPSQPLVRGRPGDPHRLGCRSNRPLLLEDAVHEQESAERGETSPTMGHESLLPVRSFGQPQTAQGGSRLSTTLMGTTSRPGRGGRRGRLTHHLGGDPRRASGRLVPKTTHYGVDSARLDRGLAARRGLPVRPMPRRDLEGADQLTSRPHFEQLREKSPSSRSSSAHERMGTRPALSRPARSQPRE